MGNVSLERRTVSLNKSEILFRWNEPWPYAWFKCKRDVSNLFTLKTPQGIVVALAPLLLLMVSVFTVIYRAVKGINVFVPAAPNLSTSMTNAPLVTIMLLSFGGFAGCLIVIVSLTWLCAFLERTIILYVNEIKLGKQTIEYSNIRSFEITISDCCPEDMPVLTFCLKDKPELSNSPIDLGIAPEIDIDHLNQSLQNRVPSVN